MSSANTTATNQKFNNRQSVIDIWNDYCDNFMKTGVFQLNSTHISFLLICTNLMKMLTLIL
jgi:hypothetical protein